MAKTAIYIMPPIGGVDVSPAQAREGAAQIPYTFARTTTVPKADQKYWEGCNAYTPTEVTDYYKRPDGTEAAFVKGPGTPVGPVDECTRITETRTIYVHTNGSGAPQVMEGLRGPGIGNADVLGTSDVVQVGVLRADAGVVQACGNRVGAGDLAVGVLQQVGAVAVQHARRAAGHAGGVLAGVDAVTGGLDADDLYAFIVEEWVEQADGVGAAADAGDQRVGQAVLLLHMTVAKPP